MEELAESRALQDVGLEGCAHARPQGKRQVLLMDRETLEVFGLAPGIVRENVTTEGLDVNGLAIGQRLQIGEVELVVSVVCDPCEQIEALRPGLQTAMQGKRGMLCKVARGGVLRRGDEIVVKKGLEAGAGRS
jgi:MOSC domain-containing protein YiiM